MVTSSRGDPFGRAFDSSRSDLGIPPAWAAEQRVCEHPHGGAFAGPWPIGATSTRRAAGFEPATSAPHRDALTLGGGVESPLRRVSGLTETHAAIVPRPPRGGSPTLRWDSQLFAPSASGAPVDGGTERCQRAFLPSADAVSRVSAQPPRLSRVHASRGSLAAAGGSTPPHPPCHGRWLRQRVHPPGRLRVCLTRPCWAFSLATLWVNVPPASEGVLPSPASWTCRPPTNFSYVLSTVTAALRSPSVEDVGRSEFWIRRSWLPSVAASLQA